MAEAELTCKELTELITEYLEEKLPQTERVRFEQHLSACSACVTYLQQMRTTINALGAKRPVDLAEIPQPIQTDLLQAFRHWKDSQL